MMSGAAFIPMDKITEIITEAEKIAKCDTCRPYANRIMTILDGE